MIRSVLSLSCVVFVDGVSYLPGYRLIYISTCLYEKVQNKVAGPPPAEQSIAAGRQVSLRGRR